MWMVGGIKLKLTRAQNFFCRRTRKSVKTEIFYSSGRYSETMRDIRMGHNRSNDCWCTGDQMPFWRILAAGQFWLCFGHPKSVEGDQMRSVSKNLRHEVPSKIYLTHKKIEQIAIEWSVFGLFCSLLRSGAGDFAFFNVFLFIFFCMKSDCNP